jgi:CBS domain containing-hemolysin-like protein
VRVVRGFVLNEEGIMSKSKIEVLSVVRAVDGITGEDVVSVQFGKVAEKTDNMQRMPVAPFGVVGPPVSLVLTLFFKFKESAPYRVGSKWDLTVSEDGSLQLQEAKK